MTGTPDRITTPELDDEPGVILEQTARTHSMVLLRDRLARAAYVSHAPPRRLLIFVHGFGGNAVATWSGMGNFDASDHFWREADLVFFDYDSLRESIKGVADRLRKCVDRYYPAPSGDLSGNEVGEIRPLSLPDYEELVLIGHSLGGLVARKAVADAFTLWQAANGSSQEGKPAALAASLRLFSPASAGVRFAGPVGSLQKAHLVEWLEAWLYRSAAFQDLQPGSEVLRATRRRTEANASHEEASALRARVLWANPEDVVLPEDYDSDIYSSSVDETDHRSVCKPRSDFREPWTFIARGEI